jgi:hypothetical protein
MQIGYGMRSLEREIVVSIGKTIRNGAAGAIIAALPIATSNAAVRPNAAVPTASSTAVAAQYDQGNSAFAGAWLPIGIIVATILVGILIASKDSHGHGDLSFG